MQLFLFLILWIFSAACFGATIIDNDDAQKAPSSKDEEPPKIGNFALPVAQQPTPLLSFGQKVIGKNVTQVFLFSDDFVGVRKHFVDIIPELVYGITENSSIFIGAPIAASYRTDKDRSSGFEDALAQFEYAFYNKSTSKYIDQATIVAGITVPTGSAEKQPPTGVGSPSFFLGGTFNRFYPDWFVFTSDGAMLTTSHNGTKFGNTYLYQFGFGRNIFGSDREIVAWLVEINGYYTEKNRIKGVIDPNSGGNVVYVTPSLFIATKHAIIQFGAGVPVTQNLFGVQGRDKYLLVTNFGWTF